MSRVVTASYFVNTNDNQAVYEQESAPVVSRAVTEVEPEGGFTLNVEALNGPEGASSVALGEQVDVNLTGLEYLSNVADPIVSGFDEGIAPVTAEDPESLSMRFVYDPDTKIGTDMVTSMTVRVEPSVAQVLTVSPDMVGQLSVIYQSLAERASRSSVPAVSVAGSIASQIDDVNREIAASGVLPSRRSASSAHSVASVRSKQQQSLRISRASAGRSQVIISDNYFSSREPAAPSIRNDSSFPPSPLFLPPPPHFTHKKNQTLTL